MIKIEDCDEDGGDGGEVITASSVIMKQLPIEQRKLAALMTRLRLLVSSLPAKHLKNLCVKHQAITTKKIMPIDLIETTMHGHLTSQPLAYFAFCGDAMIKNKSFIDAMTGNGCGVMDIVLVASIQYKKCISSVWGIMQLSMSPKNAYNLMNWLEDPRKHSRQSFKKACGGKDSNIREALMRNNGRDLNTFLRDMELHEINRKLREANDDPTVVEDSAVSPQDVVNATLPLELLPAAESAGEDKTLRRNYLELRNSCLKVVLSVYDSGAKGMTTMTDEELHLIILDVIGSYQQKAINEVFSGNADVFYQNIQKCAAYVKLSTLSTDHEKHHKKLEKVVQRSLLKRCASCGSDDADLSKCARCQAVYYCNATCQRLGWTQGGHKLVCKEKLGVLHK